MCRIRKTVDGTAVKTNALFKGAFKFTWKNCKVLLVSINVTECKADEFNIFLFYEFNNFFFCICGHSSPKNITSL